MGGDLRPGGSEAWEGVGGQHARQMQTRSKAIQNDCYDRGTKPLPTSR